MNAKTIEMQYSRSVALAQSGGKLEERADGLLEALGSYQLPDPLAHTGMRFHFVADARALEVRAHGKLIRVAVGHVWLDDGSAFPRLCGRLQFWLAAQRPEDDEVIFETVFQDDGSIRLGSEQYFSRTVSGSDLPESLRRICLGLLNAIHQRLDMAPSGG